MYANRKFTIFSLLVSLVVLSLVVSACSSSKTAASPVVAKPTQAPAKPLSTAAPANANSAGAAPSKPSSTPIAKSMPAAKPTTAAAAAPTKSVPVKPAAPAPTAAAPKAPAPTAAAPSASLQLGTAQVANDISILPSKYELVDSLESNQPKTGDKYLVVTFTIQNQSKTANYDFDPADLTIVDASGKSIPFATVKPVSNELVAKMLKPGEKVEGVVAFEVPQTDKNFTLEFKTANSPALMWMIS